MPREHKQAFHLGELTSMERALGKLRSLHRAQFSTSWAPWFSKTLATICWEGKHIPPSQEQPSGRTYKRGEGVTEAELIPKKIWKQRKDITLITSFVSSTKFEGTQPVCSVTAWRSPVIPQLEVRDPSALVRTLKESFTGTSGASVEVRIQLKVHTCTVASQHIPQS